MVLLKKRTLLSVCGAIILALGAVCALYISRDKPAMSTVGMLSSAEILVLDAGHGGEDGGAVSAAGVRRVISIYRSCKRWSSFSPL